MLLFLFLFFNDWCVNYLSDLDLSFAFGACGLRGKHNYFKDMAHRVKCYKNIPKTLASHHQHMMHMMCYYFGTSISGYILGKNTTVGPGMFSTCEAYAVAKI